MMQAGPFARIGLMVRDGDREVMQAAYAISSRPCPVTQEGLVRPRQGSLRSGAASCSSPGSCVAGAAPRGRAVTT